MERTRGTAIDWIGYGVLILLAVVIGGFSLFVGYHKAFSPLEELAKHSAWTIHLPVLLGRALGLLEIASAAVLILSLPFRRFARIGTLCAAWIGLNHAVAAIVHIIHAEWHTLTQSAVMITLCIVMTALYARRARVA